MLSGILEIQQDGLEAVADFAIASGNNLMTFGGAGIGKTEIFMQRAAAAGLSGVYLNLSVLEAPDLMGLMERTTEGKTRYCLPEKFRRFGERRGPDDLGDVLVVDEIDKARPELQNPMLELFKDRSLNGEKLHIKACLATGNLPDEHAFSQPVSHALTNRCLVYKTSAAFDPWMKWAVNAGINGLVIGYLSRNATDLTTKPVEGDETAYLHGTPRSWTNAARSLDFGNKLSVEFQTNIVAGFVGLGLAAKFRVWLGHYRHIQPAIDDLVNHGKHPALKDVDGLERIFVFGIAGANAIMQAAQRVEAGKADAKEIKRVTTNVMGWMKDVPTEYAIGALKSVLTMEVITKHELMRVHEFMESFVQIRQAWERR